ncbi:MAG: thrombospondin type 3 repeat-containing protein, partial [Nitrosopumilaceae archaeon]
MNTRLFDKLTKILILALGILLTTSFVIWYEGLDSFADSDLDGVADSIDNCPSNPNSDQLDSDKDGEGNECDNDDDNDKIVDTIDYFDNDPSEWADFDFDEVGSNQDPDDDNDEIVDIEDPTPILATELWTTKYFDQIQNCADSKSDTSRLLCFATFFDVLVENEESNSDALELALTLSKMGSLDDCHFVSHEIGHAAFEENNDVTSTLSGIDSSICRGGFYHGVLSAYFHNMKEEGKS